MSRIRRRIRPALMLIAGVCALATLSGAVPASAQAHARAATDAAEAHARAVYDLT
jgi:hypothetical protein